MRRCAWQCTDTKLAIFASNFCARKLFEAVALRPSVAIATCRKTCFPQIVLVQNKAKPYLGFQNVRCHFKILGCHFDTQKRLKKSVTRLEPRFLLTRPESCCETKVTRLKSRFYWMTQVRVILTKSPNIWLTNPVCLPTKKWVYLLVEQSWLKYSVLTVSPAEMAGLSYFAMQIQSWIFKTQSKCNLSPKSWRAWKSKSK